MKYILIILLSLVAIFATAQDILEGEREPIIVETKADLQSELELLPINYLREEKPDSLLKFNYSYHGRPLKSDFMLFLERKLTNFLNLSSGSHDRIEVTNDLFIENYSLNLNYLYRDDKGDRNANSFSMENNYALNNHRFKLSGQYLDSYKESQTLESINETKNIALSYYLANPNLKFIKNFSFKGQYETNSTSLISEAEYWNVNTEIEIEPVKHLFSRLQYSNNHKSANSQVMLYFQNHSSFGLWSGINEEKALIAPYIDLFLNYNNLTLKIANAPYTVQQSYFSQYKNHLYGSYNHENTDFMVPGNANIEVSYFNFLTWSAGSDYKYFVDSPIYRLGNFGEGIYYDSYWETSHYAKIAYLSKSLKLSTKVEFIDYNNFDAEFIPFKPELRVTNSASYKINNLTVGADYTIESKADDDYGLKLKDAHILDTNANYQINNRLSVWGEFTNILNKNSNQYFQDKINKPEFKAGIKLFF